MPPRPPPRGGARGGPPPPPPGRGGPPGSAGRGIAAPPLLPDHVQAIGVKKPGYGREGRPFQVFTNHFGATITDQIMSHYDGKLRHILRLVCIL